MLLEYLKEENGGGVWERSRMRPVGVVNDMPVSALVDPHKGIFDMVFVGRQCGMRDVGVYGPYAAEPRGSPHLSCSLVGHVESLGSSVC